MARLPAEVTEPGKSVVDEDATIDQERPLNAAGTSNDSQSAPLLDYNTSRNCSRMLTRVSASILTEISEMIVSSMIVAIGLVTFVDEPKPADVVSQPPALDQFLIVPLRVHIFVSPGFEQVNCKLGDADVTRIVGKLNSIWNKGGIHFGLESIVREQPAHTDRFRLILEMKKGEFELSDFVMLLPKPSRVFDGLQVFFFHELPFNGGVSWR